MFCMKCGQVLEDGVRFCPVCGTAVEQAQAAVNEAAQEAFDAGAPEASYEPVSDAAQAYDYGTAPEQPVYDTYTDAAAADYAYAAEVQDVIPEESASKPKGTGSLVLGIISLVLCWVPIVGLVLGIIGLVMGIKAYKKGARGLAIAGIILSAVGAVFGLIMTIFIGLAVVAIIFGIGGSSLAGYGSDFSDLFDAFGDLGISPGGSYSSGGYKMKAMMDIIANIR